jgi:hypothetical protein
MDKRLTRTDYVFALMFIFMLVCILAAFFFGLKTGEKNVETKYEKMLTAKTEAAKLPGAYDQQVLVSFYHTIYLPYAEFEKKWFQQLADIELRSTTVDSAAALKELGKIASDKYNALEGKTMPDSSPLLVEAQQNYMKSLKLFADALKSLQSKANAMRGSDLIAAMNQDAFLIEAKSFALAAQKDYFDSIIKWNQTVDAGFKPIDTSKKISVAEWGQLSLNNKNNYISAIMADSKLFEPYKPQDLTIRIDDFIASGEAKKWNVTDIQQVVKLLVSTDAVRPGDFIKGKQKFYENETLPQLPFFFEQT